MACLNIQHAYDQLLSITADGCKSGGFVVKNYQSCYTCQSTVHFDFEEAIKDCYRENASGGLSVAIVLQPRADLSCTDFGFDNVFKVKGMLLGLCIADDGQPALLLITD